MATRSDDGTPPAPKKSSSAGHRKKAARGGPLAPKSGGKQGARGKSDGSGAHAGAAERSSSELFLNRELTWLSFNARVLHEAEDERTPLLERVKFLAITGSNLDEFFMKRIGGLKQQVAAGIERPSDDGRTPRRQLLECFAAAREQEARQQALVTTLCGLLAARGVELVSYDALSKKEKVSVRDAFARNIYPLLTPQSVDPAHPFPFISNLSLNLLVSVRYPGETERSLARLKVPVGAGTPRFVRVGTKHRFVRVEDVLAENLDIVFPGMTVLERSLFRVTRNAITERSEEQADDLLALIESELQDRRFAPVVRLEALPGMNPAYRGRLAAELGLDDEADVFTPSEMLGVRDLMEIAALAVAELHDPPHHPVDNPLLPGGRNLFHILREAGPVLLQHPYESFATSVERFLREASVDPKVRAIKMTLYRTSGESGVLEHLVAAAENGKQVAVVVEIKARFDEEANIRLAERMEEAGIHVTYGVVGFKTHAKLILVVRQDYDGLRRYVHVGTGNYHPGTSRLYSDLGLFTTDDAIGADATELFNYLTTGFTPKRDYRKLLVAPKLLKKGLLSRIEREIRLHKPEDPGRIFFKMNALDDADLVRALYGASRAGVRVDLLVRDSCRLRPGVPGLSDNVRVVSVVGRFLEHSRVYYFRNGGDEEYWLGSADAMKRNLEHRVEVLAPVDDPRVRAVLRQALELQWADRRSAWEMKADGSYAQRTPDPKGDGRGSHELLIELAQKRVRGANRLKKRRASTAPGDRNRA